MGNTIPNRRNQARTGARIELFLNEFKWTSGGKEVSICGSFSDWKPQPMVQSGGEFSLEIPVQEGNHEYKFIVDGQWRHDPNMPTVGNPYGSKNNVISVKKPDSGVNETLGTGSTSSGFPPGPYSQEIPQFKKGAKPPVWPFKSPEFIHKIPLNDPLSWDSNVLPEPNHFLLNHVCSRRIEDGVLVLSIVHRYREKNFTTILYKNIDDV